ncbi:MAG: hypothetical protein AVDCRST_MAG13-1270, partial [uncultured Solirubrobacteraceae bacterium]
ACGQRTPPRPPSARDLRRGAPRRGAAERRLPADRPAAPRADVGGARDGLRPAARHGARGLHLRLRPDPARLARVRAGPRGRLPPRRGRLHGHHGRRSRGHGGRQPRRPGGGRPLRRAQHRAGLRAGAEPLPGRRALLPLLLHAEGHVRPLRERLRRLPRRLRHARRALRGARPHPDGQGEDVPRAARRHGVLERAAGLDRRPARGQGPHLAARPRPLPDDGRRRRDRRGLRAGGRRSGRRRLDPVRV